jgi:MFS superfamily sulfate permease-like transporter
VISRGLPSLIRLKQITIAIMGYVDSIVAAKQNASQFNYAISPNRELTALGIGKAFIFADIDSRLIASA